MRTAIVRRPGGPEALELVTSDRPVPGPREVLIRTLVMAVSGPDVLMRAGRYAWSPPLPFSPGNELVGVVEQVGADVDGVQPGSNVLLSARELTARGGCYAEYRAVPAAAVHVLPEGMDPAQAVTLPTYLVAHAMLSTIPSGAAPPRTVFVNGAAGMIGGALAELAKARGLRVIGTVSSEEKARHARSRGVDEVIFYRREPVLERVMEITEGRGADLAFDHVIGPQFIQCVRMLADFGTAVAYDVHTPMPDEDVFAELRRRSTRSTGVRVFNIHTYDRRVSELRRFTRELIEMLGDGRLDPVIGARFPLDAVGDAHRLFEARRTIGKIVLEP